MNESLMTLKVNKMISDYFEYYIGDVIYVVYKNAYPTHFIIYKEKITKIIIYDHSVYYYFFGEDEKVIDFNVFATYDEAKEYCKTVLKRIYDLEVQKIEEMKENG